MLSFVSMNDLFQNSPDEKLQQYEEFNLEPDNPTGYIDYIPNPTPKVKPTDIPKMDLKMVFPTYAPSIMQPQTQPKIESKIEPKIVDEVQPKVVNPVSPVASVSLAPNLAARQAYQYLVTQHKLNPHVAAGIVGNLYQESGLNPNIIGDKGTSRGIAQWHGARWQGLLNWAKKNDKNFADLNTQLDYLMTEPGQESAINATKAAKDVDDATMIFGRKFERPNEAKANWIGRKGIAQHLLTLGIK